jgi:hypothetical protein
MKEVVTGRTYSAPKVRVATGLSRERLRQLRSGYTLKRKRKSGRIYELHIAPKLEEGKDWFWSARHVVYTEAGLEKLLSTRR